MAKRFERLFEPIKIGRVTVKNRICLPSVATNFGGPHGETTEQDIGHYETIAKGGAGLITIDYACVSPEGRGMSGQRGIWGNEFIPSLSRLADAIKAHGAVASIQIHHAGINTMPEVTHQDLVGPSRLRSSRFSVTNPRELSTEEVEELVEKYADACLRAKSCGTDMIELHGTHGYLICQFISPFTNMRTDSYGRDKVLFAIEIVRRTKEKCGEDYPVIFRFDADEFEEWGITLDYAKGVAQRLEAAGVDMLNVTGGRNDTLDYSVPSLYIEDEEEREYYRFITLASEIKKVVDIPVCSGGLISDPEIAEKVLEAGMVDMVFVGRQLIADPDWPRKVESGRIENIRPCCACNDGCLLRVFNGQTLWCAVNPMTAYEYRWENEEALPKPLKSEKVLVVGAGPGGLEAARIAAIRGHKVSIVDKGDKVGGTLNIASIPSFKKRYSKLIEWYDGQLRKLGVTVQLNTKGTPQLIEKEAPDAVVIATGTEPLIPDIPGIKKSVTADNVLQGKKEAGQNVVVVGGGLVGCDTALYLSKQGKNVTIVEALPEIASDMGAISKMTFMKPGGLLQKYQIKVMTKAPVIEVKDDGVVVIDELGRRQFIEADTVILAIGRNSVLDKELVEKCKKDGREVYIIGDAKAPRKVIDAIHEGFTVALDI